MQQRLEWARQHGVTRPEWVKELPEYQEAFGAEATTEAEVSVPSGQHWLILLEAQRCGGVTLHWIASGAALVATSDSGAKRDTTIIPLRTFDSLHLPAVAHKPPVPSPRKQVQL